jgi:4-hydroxy-tetrahydrodipicolinate synthase
MIAAALTTPFGWDDEVELGGVRRLVEHVVEGGVPAVFVAGTNGEFPALDDGERLEVISTALEAAGPSKVIALVGAATTRQAARLTAEARRRGAERLAVITPYFVPAGPQRVVEHYERCAAAADGADVYVYVFTALAGTVVPPSLLGKLAEIDGIVGVKVSGAGTDVVRAYVEATPPGFEVWSGNDAELPDVLAAGGAGIVSGKRRCAAAPLLAAPDRLQRPARRPDSGGDRRRQHRRYQAPAGPAGATGRPLPDGDRSARRRAALARLLT